MKTRYEIELNYSQAMNAAKRLDEIASSVERTADKKIRDIEARIRSGWKGHNSELFRAKLLKEAEGVRKNAKKIRSAANTIRIIAANIRAAELRALELAEARVY